MTTCQAIKKLKHSKLTCPYCKVAFSQKFNRDRHVKNIQQEDNLVLVHDVTEADESTFNDLVDFNAEESYENVETIKSHAFPMNENDKASQNNNDEILNTSFISDTGEVMDVKMSIIDKDTPIYQVCENDEQFDKNCDYENLESTRITFDDIEEQMNQPIPIEPLDMNDSLGESIIKEIADRKKEKTKHHEEEFQALIIKKIKDNIKNPHTKKQQLNCY